MHWIVPCWVWAATWASTGCSCTGEKSGDGWMVSSYDGGGGSKGNTKTHNLFKRKFQKCDCYCHGDTSFSQAVTIASSLVLSPMFGKPWQVSQTYSSAATVRCLEQEKSQWPMWPHKGLTSRTLCLSTSGGSTMSFVGTSSIERGLDFWGNVRVECTWHCFASTVDKVQ